VHFLVISVFLNTKSLIVASKDAGAAAHEGKISTFEKGNAIEGTE
jgi:hypothetical protein